MADRVVWPEIKTGLNLSFIVKWEHYFTGGKGGPWEWAEIVFKFFPLEILAAGNFR